MGGNREMGLKMNKTKFTLVELLTVITVIAILMGILLPSLAAVRSKGRKAQCISNLKQMGLMSQQYVQDYKGFLPPMNHKVFEFLLPYYIDPKTKKEH
ncbi:MAG: prepilin-type N-terminal cleavage/methylation domain-containing protein, partial [Rhodothermales bacterium]